MGFVIFLVLVLPFCGVKDNLDCHMARDVHHRTSGVVGGC